ncbi:MAG: hypothetical protein SGJ19_05720 [Planctomycetia bacterium]|nr:hypothetical protein [Planctomycetia bacterium]
MWHRIGYVALLAAVSALPLGCGKATPPADSGSTSETATTDGESPSEEAAQDHHGSAPHGGTIAEWGDGNYHIEFTVDHDKKETVVYILGGDAKTASPVKADKVILSINEPAFQVELSPQPLEGEPEGTSSRFVGKHDNLGLVQEFAGTISAAVDGTPYAGEFAETAEGHVH